MNRFTNSSFVLFAIATAFFNPVQASTTWYVSEAKCNGAGGGSIQDPFCSIQSAIEAADDGDLILVEAGAYNEALTFGAKAVRVESAQGAGNTTVVGTKDQPVVQFESSGGHDSQLAGFTITGGQGGIRCFASNPRIEACIITDNSANQGGGILIINGSKPDIRDCTIERNFAASTGGGVYAAQVTTAPTIAGCRIQFNEAEHGAGIYVHERAGLTLEDSTIHGNMAQGSGGGMTFTGPIGRTTVDRCVISGNTAVAAAGIDCYNAGPQISDCTIEDNIAAEIAGGLNCKNAAHAVIARCIIRNNRAELFNGGAMTISLGSFPSIYGCTITGNFARNGGGLYVYDNASPSIFDCLVADNVAEKLNGMHGYAGGIALSGGRPSVVQCQILRNRAESGAGIGHGGSFGTVSRCVIQDNVAAAVGGGILCNGSSLQVDNSLIALNRATFNGGGIYNYSAGNPTVTNSTIAKNTAANGAGLYAGNGSMPVLTSCIVWGNIATTFSAEADSMVTATYSTIQGGWPGKSNSAVSPQFRSSTDFRLRPNSPAIDSGFLDDQRKEVLYRDLDGHARVLCAAADRGAYEFGIGDFNCNRIVDLSDWSGWAACVTGPNDINDQPPCSAFDFEYDLHIDLADVAAWQRQFENP